MLIRISYTLKLAILNLC